MASLGLVALLGLVACAYAAPGSSRLMLHDVLVKYLSETRPEILKVKEVATVLETIRNGRDVKASDIEDTIAKVDEAGDPKAIALNKKGGLDRGFVSDLIDSTLSGVHLGFSIGSSNGTANKLCIKLGNITMAGCRRTAAQKEKSNVNTPTEIKLNENLTDDLSQELPSSRETAEVNTRKGRGTTDVFGAFIMFFDLLYRMFSGAA